MSRMGSTKDTEFDAIISPDGTVTYEYDAEDEGQVQRLIKAVERRNAPRVLPLADEILTPEEAGRHLGIPKKTIIFLCAEGRLEGAFKAGRRWRVPGRAVRKMAGVP
jgi:excisionase family DNA binding protein